jgi:CRP-like cAMP-binding protein
MHIADLQVGDTFGEMELIDVQPCVATVTALSDVSVLTLSNVDLYALRKRDLKAFTLMMMNLARDISRRLRAMDSRFSGELQ